MRNWSPWQTFEYLVSQLLPCYKIKLVTGVTILTYYQCKYNSVKAPLKTVAATSRQQAQSSSAELYSRIQ